jgi:hypothetical protein
MNQEAPSDGIAGPRELAKFSGAIAVFAIFADAAIGHGLLWGSGHRRPPRLRARRGPG